MKGFRRGFQRAGGPVFLQVSEKRQQQIVFAVGGLALIGMCSIVLLTVVIGGISTKNEVAYGKKADEMI